jgi:hypothetical protein
MKTLARTDGGKKPGETTPGSMCRASQLGGVEESKRSSTNVQDDPDTNRTRGIWGIPATYREGINVHMSSLSNEGGLGIAHPDILPGVGRT